LRNMPLAPSSVVIIQPALMLYRQRVYGALNQILPTRVICTEGKVQSADIDFEYFELPCRNLGRFQWQTGIRSIIKKVDPAVVWIAADVNYLSSLALTFWCKRHGIKVILHGQGLIKKSGAPKLRKFMLQRWIDLADTYVGYTEKSTQSIRDQLGNRPHLVTINNRLELDSNTSQIKYQPRTGKDVMFIGRLRKGSQIDLLIDAMATINSNSSNPFTLHIIGDGEYASQASIAAAQQNWIIWHGAINDREKLLEIAQQCAIGVYPGAAGLSVVTYMELGLATIVGDDLSLMQGPEPEYIIDGYNGWLYKYDDTQDLQRVLTHALISDELQQIQMNAIATFNKLHSKSYAQEMADVIMEISESAYNTEKDILDK